MSEDTSWWRSWEVTIDSDWITTTLMAALFVICLLFLAQEIRLVVQGHFFGPTRLRVSFWSIQSKVFEVIVAIYFLIFAFRFPKKSVKLASALMGTNFAVYALLSCFSLSSTVGQVVAVIGSVARQIALTIFCVAIAQWLKTVVHWGSPGELRGGEN